MTLFNLRKMLCQNKKTEPWNMRHLEGVLKTLKKGQSTGTKWMAE